MKIPFLFKHRWFQFIIVVVVIFSIYFLTQTGKKNPNIQKTATAVIQDLKEVVSVSGQLEAGTVASLKFQAGGKIVWVGVKKGDTVKKWQAIASLDQQDLQTRFKKALLSYQTARLTFDQTLEDNKDQVIGRNYLDIQTVDDESQTLMRLLQKNQISLDQSVADVEIANIAKQYGTLYSPIDGIVIKASDENPGVNVSATTEYIVVDPASLRFEAEVEELDITKIHIGEAAKITLDAMPDNPFDSQVSGVEFTSTVNTSGNTVYKVYLPLAPNANFRMDLSGNADIIVNEKSQVLSIPVDMVLEDEAGKYVILKDETNYVKRTILTGIETNEFYEVLSGLTEGETAYAPTPEIEKRLSKE